MSCCKEYAQSISEYLDGALNEKEQQLLLEHMEGCEKCRNYLAELAAMHDALSESEEIALPEGFHENVMNRVRAKKRAKKTMLWKRYAAVAACAAIVLVGAVRLMPHFGADSAAPETADMVGGAAMENGMAVEEEAPQAAAGGSVQRAAEDAENYSYVLDSGAALKTESAEAPEAEAQMEEVSFPVVRGENVRETLLSLGAQELSGPPWLLVPVEVLENLPEGLTLEGEYDKTAELITVLPEEVTA